MKVDSKECKDERYLLTLEIKQFRSSVKEKHSVGKSRLQLCREKNVEIGVLIISRNCDREIMQPIMITN